ncbi:MAG: F0F1 ATP synthase subunit B [Saprospiraceae bacterium]|nr:F0F1 ATP synthase subunit B [Saprospiraceae bacterium]
MMISLFSVFQPSPGLAVWSLLIFVLFWTIAGRFAFKPIAKALEKRQNDIQHALDSAKLAREEVSDMKAENEKLLAQAREERSKILQEAKDLKNQIVNEAKEKAKEEATKIINNAKQEIDNQTKAAVADAKSKLGAMSVEIAEKLIRRELKSNADHDAYVKGLVDEMNLN